MSTEAFAAMKLDEGTRALLRTSFANYARHALVRLSVDSVNGKEVWCTAYQHAPAPNGDRLSEAALLQRSTEVFQPIAAHGYTPIISVYSVEKGPPEKPIAKHRMAGDITLRGQQAAVLRQAPPRMLFVHDGVELKLLALEHIASGPFFAQLAAKAEAWLARARYRR